jgi:3-oxoacyl-[acyl-carrier protein] reductase
MPVLLDRVAIITGAGSGIGRAIAERFAQAGVRVAVNYSRSREAAEEVAAGIRASGGSALPVHADVSVESETVAMVRTVEQQWGRLDVVVNNAGWSTRIPHEKLEDLTDEIWDRTLNVNLRGAFYTARAAAPLLRRQAGSSIVNVASTAAFTGFGSSIVYAASKAGVVSLTKSLARALAPSIRVNAVAPGFVRTRFANWPQSAFDQGEAVTPLARLATVEEVANTAFFLAFEGTAITGETVIVDGGLAQLRRTR